MDIFFCDIIGTLTGENEQEEIQKFMDNLRKLSEMKKIKNLEFSLITTDDLYCLKKTLDKIKNCNLNQISFGPQFCEKRILTGMEILEQTKNNKIDIILEYIKEKNINNFFYADDNKLNVMVTEKVIKSKFPNANVMIFNPHGIKNLNDQISNYLNEKTKIKEKN